MKKSRKMNEFRWPFAKRRQTWIAEADKISAEAANLFSEGEFAATNRLKKLKRAASLHEHAAEFYRKAGLGLAAANSYDAASDVWAVVGDQDATKHCEEMSAKIDRFWIDEEGEEGNG